jgi:alanyl-tRNA synthetase
MKANEIRQKYLEFFRSKGHAIIDSASILPENDSTILFVNSGMSPLVPFLLGEKHPGGVRLANSQKSFRTEDIEEVGDNRHNTFFEMLGNWSLGDYFKNEQLNWWYEFLVDELKLDPKRLYQTVYAGDELVPKDNESIDIMKNIFSKYGVTAEEGEMTTGKGDLGPGVEIDFTGPKRIFAYRDKNWWMRGDAVGELGGPDSETFYDTGKRHDSEFGQFCHLNCDCGRFLEIGNSVFMQYQRTETSWKELANKNVDFGGGLERVAMVVNNYHNIFETDLFANIIFKIESLSGLKYRDDMKSFEIIADHLKAATFIMCDDRGMPPSNTGQGYIIRRLIRRAVRFGKHLNIKEGLWTKEIAKIVAHDYANYYSEFKRNIDRTMEWLNDEEMKFNKTLERGLKELEKLENANIESDKIIITGADSFNLYQTYGFPIEMTEEIAKEKGLSVDMEGYRSELSKHQDLSRTASAGMFKGGLADASIETTKLHTAAHLLLQSLRIVLGKHVVQKGSNITSERLRFDFSHPEKMSDEQLKQVEDNVNRAIGDDLAVTCEEMPLEDARKAGAMGVFESKYEEKVKVYSIGEKTTFSREICGGPHVKNTGELGKFKIIKEESSSAGVRRIKARLEN